MINNKKINLTSILFIVYIVSLVWIILFKLAISFDDLPQFRNVNLIPFKNVNIINGKVDINGATRRDIINNFLIFIPFGIYTSMLKDKWSFFGKIIPIFLMSLSVEILQYIFAIGATDITDVIVNTTGGIAGVFGYYVFSKIFKNKASSIMTIIALIATTLMLALIGMLLISN